MLNDLHDATEFATSVTDSTESDDTTVVGTKFDRKDLITSTSGYLAHGTSTLRDSALHWLYKS